MNDDTVIQLNNISKCYKTFETKRDRLLNILVPSHKARIQETWALKDVSLEIKRGDSVAIIGRNGSGKSTLLEILTGTLKPTSGSASVAGRVSALLELGSGFNPQYSGRDNVILNGLLLGLRKKDILQRFAEIENFADIGAAIDRPVKTYSSGMIMRLAFAVQVLCDPEILIIDEALSVGDFFFQQKCLNYIQALRKQGVTLLFVSHDMGAVRDLCQTGIYLKKGELTFFGKNSTAINHYLSESNTTNYAPIQQPIAAFNNELPQAIWTNTSPSTPSLLEVGLYNSHNEATTSFNIGEQLTFRVRFISNDKDHTQVMLTLRNRNSQIITSQGTYNAQLSSDATSNGIREARFDVTANLEAGQYSFTFTLSSNFKTNTGSILYETPELGPLTVHWNYETAIPPFYGMFGLPMKISYPSF